MSYMCLLFGFTKTTRQLQNMAHGFYEVGARWLAQTHLHGFFGMSCKVDSKCRILTMLAIVQGSVTCRVLKGLAFPAFFLFGELSAASGV